TNQAGANACLTRIATAGGKGRPDSAFLYYPATSESAFNTYFGPIIDEAACHLEVDGPISPATITLDVGFPDSHATSGITTVHIDRDPTLTNGWDFDKSTTNRISVFGSACSQILIPSLLVSSNTQYVHVQGCQPTH